MALRHSIGDLATTFMSMVRTRLELIALEASAAKSRLIRVLCMALGALIFITLALLVFSMTVALYFWPTEHRYVALGVLALIYVVIGLGLLWAVVHGLRNGPLPFAATLDELQRDIRLAKRLGDPSDTESRGSRHD